MIRPKSGAEERRVASLEVLGGGSQKESPPEIKIISADDFILSLPTARIAGGYPILYLEGGLYVSKLNQG